MANHPDAVARLVERLRTPKEHAKHAFAIEMNKACDLLEAGAALADGVSHMTWCRVCAEDGCVACDDGRAALAARDAWNCAVAALGEE